MIGIVCAFFHTEGKGFYSKYIGKFSFCKEKKTIAFAEHGVSSNMTSAVRCL